MDFTSLPPDKLARNLPPAGRAGGDARSETAQWQDAAQDVEVHRIELEMQNSALRDTQAELEEALQRYTDLYDHLPIGYVTLTPHGKITQANLTAAQWLRRD